MQMNMTSKIQPLTLFLLFGFSLVSCEFFEKDAAAPDNAQAKETVLRDTVFTFLIGHIPILDAEDPNSDKNWDWEAINSPVDTYVLSEGKAFHDAIGMPWHTQGNKMNVVNPDIKASDGWIFVLRDFGTEKRGVLRPYFSLYNKNTGRLFFAVRNSLQQSGSFAKGKLSVRTSSGEVIGIFLSGEEKFNQFDGWFNFHFDLKDSKVDLANTSPDITLEVVGVSETRVQF